MLMSQRRTNPRPARPYAREGRLTFYQEIPSEAERLAGVVGVGAGTQPTPAQEDGRPPLHWIDLRRMLERATGYRGDVVEDRWVIETKHRGRCWEVIMEPDWERRVLVVVTAYAVWE